MFNLLSKSIILWQKPKVIVIAGQDTDETAEAVCKILNQRFSVVRFSKNQDIYKKEVIILETDLENEKNIKDLKFIFKKSKLPVLTIIETIKEEKADKFKNMIKTLPAHGRLITSFENKKFKDGIACLTFGQEEGSDYQATNITTNSKTNFKLNYKGNIVPIWLDNSNQISAALAAAATAATLGLNLVEVSAALKS